jgi:hypothetical protein
METFETRDDIGASPMTFALLVAADTTDRLVYYGYRSHIWNPESSSALKRFNGRTQDQRMKAAISEGVGVYGLDKDVLKMKRPTTMPRDKRRNQSWYPPSTQAAKQ